MGFLLETWGFLQITVHYLRKTLVLGSHKTSHREFSPENWGFSAENPWFSASYFRFEMAKRR